MSLKPVLLTLVLVASGAWAQTTTPDFSPPPMVPASPPPMPPPDPSTTQSPGTPPPPAMVPPSSYVPGQTAKSAYPYSPYGQPKSQEKPGPEIGLMVSESLFGALTAAGVTILPYFLLFAGGNTLGDPTVSSVIFILIFGAMPLAVAQTEVSLANGSRFYQTDTWPAALTGLAGMAGVLGIYYATGWLPTAQASGGVPNGGSTAWLMIGSIAIVPLLQMAVINLFKTPKPGMMLTFGDPVKRNGVAFASPTLSPVVTPNAGMGAQLSLLRGIF